MKNFTVTHTMTAKRISDVLTCALEGGSNSWCRVALALSPTTWEFASEPEDGHHYYQDYPLNPGGALLIVDDESDDDRVLALDGDALQKGLTILAEKYPHHMADILALNDDAFLQCCLFGGIIYG